MVSDRHRTESTPARTTGPAARLVEECGGRYSTELGIDLARSNPDEIYKWFLAALLFGARISGTIAARTYREFEQAAILAPQRVLDAGWDRLVEILDRGGYARYDFKTATKLLDVNRALLRQYKGDLNLLHAAAKDGLDLQQRLKNLGKGIGDITVNIFLRELRGVWSKADPPPSERAITAAKELGFVPSDMHDAARMLELLQGAWRAEKMAPEAFADFEAALVRYETRRRKNSVPD